MEQQEPGVTLKQVNFIKQLVGRQAGRVEPDYNKLSMKEAKELIRVWLADGNTTPTPERIRDEQSTTDKLLTQILEELRKNGK